MVIDICFVSLYSFLSQKKMVYSSSKLREKVSLASNPDNSNKTSYSVMMQNYIQDENAKHEKANSNAIFEEETEEKTASVYNHRISIKQKVFSKN